MGGEAPLLKGGEVLAILGGEAGMVVVDLVVVPGNDPRARCVVCLEVWVGFVERVSRSVLVESRDLG